jgi:hypothetical protein
MKLFRQQSFSYLWDIRGPGGDTVDSVDSLTSRSGRIQVNRDRRAAIAPSEDTPAPRLQ